MQEGSGRTSKGEEGRKKGMCAGGGEEVTHLSSTFIMSLSMIVAEPLGLKVSTCYKSWYSGSPMSYSSTLVANT